MPIGRKNIDMEYKYAGKTFDIRLEDSGKLSCYELGIEENTADEVKARIRELTEKEKKLESIIVLLYDYGMNEIIEAKSTLKKISSDYSVRREYIWVSWKELNQHRREKKSVSEVYLNTPENLALLNILVEKRKVMMKLNTERQEAQSNLQCVTAINL